MSVYSLIKPPTSEYAQHNDGDVFHYRDKSSLEADMIVALRDGRWGAIEENWAIHKEFWNLYWYYQKEQYLCLKYLKKEEI